MKIRLLFLFLLLWNFSEAQNCSAYIRLSDASGFDTNPYQTMLKDAACELQAALPAEFQDQFKVFDFGFYLHNEGFQEGYEGMFEHMIQEVKQLSPYYVLFGKVTSSEGVYTHLLMDAKLPEHANFPCLNEGRIGLAIEMARYALEETYNNQERRPSASASAEAAAMEELQYFIKKMVDCCDLDFRSTCDSPCMIRGPAEVMKLFENRGMLNYNHATVNITEQSYSTIDSGHSIEVTHVDEGGNSRVWQLTDELNDIVQTISNSSGTNASAQVLHFNFDESECDTALNNYIQRTSVEGNLNGSSSVRSSGNDDFYEEIVILEFDGQVKVYYYFSIDKEIDQNSRAIFPAYAAYWLAKKAVMAGTGVVLHLLL